HHVAQVAGVGTPGAHHQRWGDPEILGGEQTAAGGLARDGEFALVGGGHRRTPEATVRVAHDDAPFAVDADVVEVQVVPATVVRLLIGVAERSALDGVIAGLLHGPRHARVKGHRDVQVPYQVAGRVARN